MFVDNIENYSIGQEAHFQTTLRQALSNVDSETKWYGADLEFLKDFWFIRGSLRGMLLWNLATFFFTQDQQTMAHGSNLAYDLYFLFVFL